MAPTLRELLEHDLLTLDEAQELEGYVTSSPQTWMRAPWHLQQKVWRGVVLLDLDETEAVRH